MERERRQREVEATRGEIRPQCEEIIDAFTARRGFHAVLRPKILDLLPALIESPQNVEARKNAAGFIYLQLSFDSDRSQPALRIHIWPDDETRTPPVPHTHSCRIDSVILCGSIENSEYKIAERGVGIATTLMQAECGVDTCTHVPRKANDVSFYKHRSSVLHAGSTYSIEHGDFHSTGVVSGEFAATCVVMSDFRAVPTFLINTGVRDLSGTLEKEHVAPQRIDRYLRKIGASLEAPRPASARRARERSKASAQSCAPIATTTNT